MTTKTKIQPNPAERVVVVGYGWVGQANALSLAKMGYDVAYYDPKSPEHHYTTYRDDYAKVTRLGTVNERDHEDTWYVVCVGDRVSEDGVQDVSLIRSALETLKGLKGKVILRSTILPDVLETIRFHIYVPEFLHEKKAVEESLEPYFFVMGTKDKTLSPPSFLAVWREYAPHVFVGTPREAAYVKYLSNLWNAVRIAFVNEFGHTIAKPQTKDDIADIERVVDFVFGRKQYLRYGRAFGGHCLPKDTRAFVRWHKDKGYNTALLEGTYQSNQNHERFQEEYPAHPEWFSEWLQPQISGREAAKVLWRSVVRNLSNPSLLFRKGKRTHSSL